MFNDYFATGPTGAPDPIDGERPKKLKYSVGGEWKEMGPPKNTCLVSILPRRGHRARPAMHGR